MNYPSRKLKKLPPYLFGAIDILKKRAYEKKLDVIDLCMGNPDLPTPKDIVERLCDTVLNHSRTHRYPQAKGMPKFRKAILKWFKKRFGVELDPEEEILALIGSKEGIAHFFMSWLEEGELVLVPSPCYPVHYNGVILAGGEVYTIPLLKENNYLPDLSKIPEEVARRAKILVLNYPNNPTTAVVKDLNFFEEVVRFAKKYDIIVLHDAAYSEITFDGYVAPSFLQVKGSKDVAVEFHSFSKTFNMAGWRIGWVCGNRELIKPLEKLKSYLDYGVPTFIQLSGVKALEIEDKVIGETLNEYKRRRDYFYNGLKKLGWEVELPKATMYLWAKIPEPFSRLGSLQFAELLIDKTGVACAPGIGFGPYGEGYVRFALVTHYNRFHDALLRIKKFMKEGGKYVKTS
ncbi:MAG: LL-diaminopimelate aminotransferase [Caldiserica bacterium]|nr:MAG: LL-diaminopimelate aminotransferase [Caldisericota bacterium]